MSRTMPLDTSLLYGEMAGSWILHLGIPFGLAMAVRAMPSMGPLQTTLVFIGLCTLSSFVCQSFFLAILQAHSCDGMKDVGSIFRGGMIAALITAIAVAIPSFIEPMRLLVSQLFLKHKTLYTPDTERQLERLITAVQSGGALTQADYEAQTFQEIAIGASYWSAFAGAYGIGIGSLFAAKCPTVT